MDTLQGQILIANGSLFDPTFRQAVILMVGHNDEGAIGVVLNRPAVVSVGEAAPALAGIAGAGEPLYVGGPVEQQTPIILAEFEHPDLAGRLVFDSIGLPEGATEHDLERGIVRARIYAGYAGWGPGQLEGELGESSWIVAPARPEDVFTDRPEQLWSDVLRRRGPEFQMLSMMPFDPSMN